MEPIVIIGAGGHASVVADVIMSSRQYRICGCVDKTPQNRLADLGITYLGDDEALPALALAGVQLAAMGLGGLENEIRWRLFGLASEIGFCFPPLVHPSAVVGTSASLGRGSIVMAGAVLSTGVLVGDNVIINTSASVDHDCVLGDSSHIAPGAVLCGGVTIGDKAFVGAGACIIQGVMVGADSVIGAGAVVVHDVPPGAKVVGNPARFLNADRGGSSR